MLHAILTSLIVTQQTFCNPLNLDYGYCPIPDFSAQGRHRTTADPAIVQFQDDFYLFSTNQWGYWWSHDMLDWTFVPRHFLRPEHHVYDDLCAPAPFVIGDTLYVIGSTYTKDFPIWASKNPKKDEWHEAVHAFEGAAWDPAFFLDDDGRLYLYHGSSNVYPIYGVEVDRKTLQPVGEHVPLMHLSDHLHGWERFGEANDNTFMRPFVEGAWMTKHNGTYYLQYGAPGTEFTGYADGVYVSKSPLGPFHYQTHNPFSYKPGGFAPGAGHGATFQDSQGAYWHVSTSIIGVKNNFERRNSIWPAGFDDEGTMYCDTAYGDWPLYLPSARQEGKLRPNWMLLNYGKGVVVSSSKPGHGPNFAVDEDIRTYWSARSNSDSEFLVSDLGEACSIHAVQINYADENVDTRFLGKIPGLSHKYRLLASMDGASWKVIVDKSKNTKDVPHDYIEFAEPIRARYIRIENVSCPGGDFALSGLRVFGLGAGAAPAKVDDFVVLRGKSEPRNAWLKWREASDATGYVIYAGVKPDALYTSVMVFGTNQYTFRAMTKDQTYYFAIEAFNENGISARTEPMKAAIE